jgi:broad specificity phosphatase PhoE
MIHRSVRGGENRRVRSRNIPEDYLFVLISSPQPRALQTAEEISRAVGKPIVKSALFIERLKPTVIEGKPWSDEEAARICKEWERSMTTPGLKVFDGENFESSIERADRALKFLEDREEEDILVVTHGHFTRSLLARIMLGDSLTGETLGRFYARWPTANRAPRL